MIKRDFHGWTVDDTLKEVDRIIGDVRINNRCEHAEFITGRGAIREQITYHIREYNLHPETKWGNDGVIVVMIQ